MDALGLHVCRIVFPCKGTKALTRITPLRSQINVTDNACLAQFRRLGLL